VTVNFNDHKALDSLSLIVPARGKVAIVGPSAAGKTTMLRLIQGLLYPNTGVMEVDGHNFRGLDINNYRNQVATVDANPVFFTCSIEENLRWVRPNISDRELEEALNLSGLSQMMKDLPDGLSTEISQNGAPLSQGTRTCLAIARCLISQPRVLLLDEALTTLDKSSQVWLIENLDEIARGRTLIMSTHDLRFTAGFDSIIVLESGVLAGQGTHHELLANCPIYKQLWDLDLSLSRTSRSDKPRKVKLGST
jgi:ATP-binding cassette subfamily B protein